MKPIACCLLIITQLIFLPLFAQKGKMEKIARICKSISPENKTTLAVTSFSNSTKDTNKLRSAGLIDMLSNALFNTGCYNIVERKNLKEIIEEQDLTNSKRVDSKTAIKIGKLKGTNFLVMGNVTEFSENTGGVGLSQIVGTRLGSVIGGIGEINAHIGMIIKLVDVRTGVILESKSFERTVNRAGMIGGATNGTTLNGGAAWTSQAMEDAAEELIIDIVQYISKSKTLIAGLKDDINSKTQSKEVVIKNIKYDYLQKLCDYLKSNSSISKIEKTYDDKTAKLDIETTLTTDELTEFINNYKELRLQVISLSDNKVELKGKSSIF